jgi:heme/copper-type cytochrome/quinol oxidase subunit 2
MTCPKCGSFMDAQAVPEIRKRGCLLTLFYIILLFVPVIGWIALFCLIRGRRSRTVTYGVCQNCGYRRRV